MKTKKAKGLNWIDRRIPITKQIQMLEWLIAGCVGASVTLIMIIAHMMITGPAWTW